jgi:hypothetical protein
MVTFHPDFVASILTDFFQGQTIRDLFYSIGITIPGKPSCPNNNNNKKADFFIILNPLANIIKLF